MRGGEISFKTSFTPYFEVSSHETVATISCVATYRTIKTQPLLQRFNLNLKLEERYSYSCFLFLFFT